MEAIESTTLIRTRLLILSDTHGKEFGADDKPRVNADVAIHCGDLTESSFLEEYRACVRLLKDINAPLKLVIAGNHDFTMDPDVYETEVANARQALGHEAVKTGFGDYSEARQLFEEAKGEGIVLLDQGNHQFILENGASLTVYASPWTPSLAGNMGFQYRPARGHNFAIQKGVDLVITHGPPEGILDYVDRKRAGCPHLFAAVAQARPRLHCFGHIHERWGAKMVKWQDPPTEMPSYWTDIDNDESFFVQRLSGLNSEIREKCRHERCYKTSHCTGDTNALEPGRQTLFVNAAIQGTEEHPYQLPWLVDLELPRAE
ncbi:MAG: hypothetical protein Q9208_001076 [Pyrenodesmia sp. 3 TL-2023]